MKITTIRTDSDIREALELEAKRRRSNLSTTGKQLWMEALKAKGHVFDSGPPAPAAPPSGAVAG